MISSNASWGVEKGIVLETMSAGALRVGSLSKSTQLCSVLADSMLQVVNILNPLGVIIFFMIY